MALISRLRPTHGLGALAVGTTVAVVALEYAHVWRRGHAPLPSETDNPLEASFEAAVETVEVAVEGYKSASPRETALLNLLFSFSFTFASVRVATRIIRSRGSFGPLRNLIISDRHIHHFVPGIVMAFLAGGASVVSRNEDIDQWLALPFGAGMALTLDEAALLIQLEDVYWTEEGVLSVQVTLAAMALLGSAALGLRLLRRGEEHVLEPPAAASTNGHGPVALSP